MSRLERELRTKDDEVHRLERQLADSQRQLVEQDLQLVAHRDAGMSSSPNPFAMASQSEEGGSGVHGMASEEVVAAWGSVTGIKIQKLMSGIRWESGKPVLHVVVRPVDADGELKKVAGKLSLRAQSTLQSPSSNNLAEGEWSITESRQLWTKSLVSSGFHVQVPVENIPLAQQSGQLFVTAGLDLGKGRKFETSVTLNLAKTAR